MAIGVETKDSTAGYVHFYNHNALPGGPDQNRGRIGCDFRRSRLPGIGRQSRFGLDEHQRMELPFPPAGERVARLEEVIQMALQLWSGENTPFEGKYYSLTSTIGALFFVQQPHPPILIAGHGNKMLRLMARNANVVSIGFGQQLDDMRTKLAYLREQCEALNRPYEEIEKTTFFTSHP